MGELADRLDGIRVRASAPGVELDAELRDRTMITLKFGESVYEFASERALESALAGLARLLYARWQRAYLEAIATTDLTIDPRDQHDLDFLADRAAVGSSGTSPDGRVTISAIGMDTFTAHISPAPLANSVRKNSSPEPKKQPPD